MVRLVTPSKRSKNQEVFTIVQEVLRSSVPVPTSENTGKGGELDG